jgi:hypothetical protein
MNALELPRSSVLNSTSSAPASALGRMIAGRERDLGRVILGVRFERCGDELQNHPINPDSIDLRRQR